VLGGRVDKNDGRSLWGAAKTVRSFGDSSFRFWVLCFRFESFEFRVCGSGFGVRV
jgi:hypothetical protein